MARKRRLNGEMISALREAEVRVWQGEAVGKICRTPGTQCKPLRLAA